MSSQSAGLALCHPRNLGFFAPRPFPLPAESHSPTNPLPPHTANRLPLAPAQFWYVGMVGDANQPSVTSFRQCHPPSANGEEKPPCTSPLCDGDSDAAPVPPQASKAVSRKKEPLLVGQKQQPAPPPAGELSLPPGCREQRDLGREEIILQVQFR